MSGPRQDCSSRGQGRPKALEEGVRLPPASTSRERLLQVQIDRRRQAPSTWSESPSGRGTTRLQRPQPDDRDRSADLNRHRKLNSTESGTSQPSSRSMHQRLRTTRQLEIRSAREPTPHAFWLELLEPPLRASAAPQARRLRPQIRSLHRKQRLDLLHVPLPTRPAVPRQGAHAPPR